MIDFTVSVRTDERAKALPETDDGQFAIASFNGPRGWVSLIGRPGQVAEWRKSLTFMQNIMLAVMAQDFGRLAAEIGFDFSLVAYDRRYHKVYLARGGIGRYRLYFEPAPHGSVIRGHLSGSPIDFDRVDADGLSGYLVHAAHFGAFDTNHTEKTVVPDVYRVPRSCVIELEPGRPYWYRHDFVLPRNDDVADMDTHELFHAVRQEVDMTLQLYAAMDNTVEVSGGIDSAILAARLKALAPELFRFGISIEYPYYEFRFERPGFIEPVYEQLGIDAVYLDGGKIGMFDRMENLPPHDEPSRASGAFAQMMSVFPAAVERGAEAVFNGQGGDQIFGTRPTDWAGQLARDCPVDWLLGHMKDRCMASLGKLRSHITGPEMDRPMAYWGGLMLHDGWADRYVTPQMGLRYECGFVSSHLLELVHEYRRRISERGHPHKFAAREIFADELPESLRLRRSKVAYDGVSIRAFHRNRDALVDLVDGHADHLRGNGIHPRRVLKHLDRVVQGENRGRHLLMALFGYLLWRKANMAAGGATSQWGVDMIAGGRHAARSAGQEKGRASQARPDSKE